MPDRGRDSLPARMSQKRTLGVEIAAERALVAGPWRRRARQAPAARRSAGRGEEAQGRRSWSPSSTACRAMCSSSRGLMAQRVPFIVTALGRNVDPFMLHIYAALAEKERRADLGAHQGGLGGRERARRAARQPAGRRQQGRRSHARCGARAVLHELAGQPYRAIAAGLTSRGIAAPRGGAWNHVTVMRVMRRLGLSRAEA